MYDDHDDTAEKLGHEPIGVGARSVSIGMAALMGVVLASMLLVGGLMLVFASIWGGPATVGVPPSAPALEDQKESLRKLRTMENRLLTEYAWLDEQAGVARIPIERAMQIQTERLSTIQKTQKTQETPDENRGNNP